MLFNTAQFLEKRIEKVRDEEKNNRQDLFTLSSSYLGQLKQRLNGGHMMKESEFHIPVEKDKVNICRSFLIVLLKVFFFLLAKGAKNGQETNAATETANGNETTKVNGDAKGWVNIKGLHWFIYLNYFKFLRKGCKRSTGEENYTSGSGGTKVSQGYY